MDKRRQSSIDMTETMPAGGWYRGRFDYHPVSVKLYSRNKNEIAANPTHVYEMFAKMGITPVPGIYHEPRDGMVMIVSLLTKK